MSCVCRLIAVSTGCLLFLAQDGFSQANREGEGKEPALNFWDTQRGFQVQAAAELAVERNPYAWVATRLAAADAPLLWPDWQLPTDSPPLLSRSLLAGIVDNTIFPDETQDRRPGDIPFYLVYCDALVYASQTPVEDFDKQAEEQRRVTYGHLLGDPRRYRGKVIPIEGTLLRVREIPPPRPAELRGVKVAYECWIKLPVKRTKPVLAVTAELPPGITPAERMDREVRFAGYFLKLLRFRGEKGEKPQEEPTPFLVGRSVTVVPEAAAAAPAETGPRFTTVVLYAIVGFALSLTALIFGVHWWLRNSDQKVQARLRELRERNVEAPEAFPPPPVVVEEPATPQASGEQNGTAGHPEPRRDELERPGS